jgi:hypothetical protein
MSADLGKMTGVAGTFEVPSSKFQVPKLGMGRRADAAISSRLGLIGANWATNFFLENLNGTKRYKSYDNYINSHTQSESQSSVGKWARTRWRTGETPVLRLFLLRRSQCVACCLVLIAEVLL